MLSKLNQSKIRSKLNDIYKSNYSRQDINYYIDQIKKIIKQFNGKNKKKKKDVNEKTSLLICYGDSIFAQNQKHSLKVFKNFFHKKLSKYFNSVHFLPFYPSSSDSGFAVKDHYKIDSKLGTWTDIKNFSKKIDIMADIVINHSSARGLWFKNFLKKKRPGKDYFLTVNSKFNTSKVVRPRDHKLLKRINFFKQIDYLWRTFSPDQLDLNFKNPTVLLRFIKIMINLIDNGVTIFRLDAIAYLWKESGTKCINLKKTHDVVKLLRIISSQLNKQSVLVTETNLPERENLSYFGKNDEANWIYNFSLSPLLLHTFLFENSFYLNKWSKKLPESKYGNCYLNFLASHDGIGIRPTEGILNNKDLKDFLSRLKKNGSKFSYRTIQNKSKKVYEANITVFNALKKSNNDPEGKFSFERYVAAHAIMFSFEGIPALYLNSLFGKSNDEAKYIITGNNRDINRYKWNYNNIMGKLNDNKSKQSVFYKNLGNLLNIRRKQKAFHPNAKRFNFDLGSKMFAFKRVSIDKKQSIICITNVTSKNQDLKLNKKLIQCKDLINPKIKLKNKNYLIMKPFQTLWLTDI